MNRHLDLYRLERRAQEFAFILSLAVTRSAVLGWYRLGDARRRMARTR